MAQARGRARAQEWLLGRCLWTDLQRGLRAWGTGKHGAAFVAEDEEEVVCVS